MSVSGPGSRWLYEPDERPKRKHRWRHAHAGFVEQCGEKVGKCPSDLTDAMAEELLNTQAVPYFNPKARGPSPDRLYVVHEGVVYRAVPTRAGRSFHGFPESPEHLARLPRAVLAQILALAERLGCKDRVQDWMSG